MDRAGNIGSAQRSVQIDRQFSISGHAPADGVTDVGVSSRPRIQFTSAVDPDSVNASSFYASAGGAVLPGTVVVSNDARTAWLYVTGAMPGNSRVEITVEGDLIRSADDRVLDADGDGAAAGRCASASPR